MIRLDIESFGSKEIRISSQYVLNDYGCFTDATLADVQVAGVQIASGGIGVDLSRARYAAYYSLGFSLTDYEQSLARLHRPGQTRNVVYYHLLVEGSVDRRVYGALRARKQVIEAVLEEYRHGDGDEKRDGH